MAFLAYMVSQLKRYPFSLISSVEAIVLVEFLVPSTHLNLNVKLEPDVLWMLDLEAFDEKHDKAKLNLTNYH